MKALRKSYDGGGWGDISPGNATNALVVLTKPSEGYFAHCVGPASRGMAPMSPKTFANPIYAETNAFWELRLKESPEAITAAASQIAHRDLEQARSLYNAELGELEIYSPVGQRLVELLEEAAREIQLGQDFESKAITDTGADSIYDWARAVRAFTRSQVRARQVSQALRCLENSPEALLA